MPNIRQVLARKDGGQGICVHVIPGGGHVQMGEGQVNPDALLRARPRCVRLISCVVPLYGGAQ